MKRVTLICCGLLFQVIYSSISFSQKKAAWEINAGIGIWRMMSLDEAGTINGYQYPIGYTVGISVENPLFDHFSLVNELRYQNSTTTVLVGPGVGEMNEKVMMKQLIVPVLMKYQVSLLGESYFLLGPSIGYLVNAQYEYVIDDDTSIRHEGRVAITKDLPAIETALEFGVGKGIQISGGTLNLELRGQWGLTRFHYKRINDSTSPDIGSWKNAGIQFVIGYMLN